MRKCFLKKALASILSSAMIVSAVPQADLATISAAKKNVGLNTTFKTLKVGKSYKLKLKNNSINWKIQKISTTNKKNLYRLQKEVDIRFIKRQKCRTGYN